MRIVGGEGNTTNMLVVDGQRRFGQRTCREAVSEAIRRVKDTTIPGSCGVCVLACRNGRHIGRVGSYGKQVGQCWQIRQNLF